MKPLGFFRAVLISLCLQFSQFAFVSHAYAQFFPLDGISFCQLLSAQEIERATGREFVKFQQSPNSCEWLIKPQSPYRTNNDIIRVIARLEHELPPIMKKGGLESLTQFHGPSLSKMHGAAELILQELEPGVMGAHTDCGFYMFSLEMELDGDIDYQNVGRELGVLSLWRFNNSLNGTNCYAKGLIEDQYPDFNFPVK